MRLRFQSAVVVLLAVTASAAQMPFPFPRMPRGTHTVTVEPSQPSPVIPAATRVSMKSVASPPRRGVTLTKEDGFTVMSTALQKRKRRGRQPDCSHLVNDVYKRAGFDYEYARSSDLFVGVKEFKRVGKPQPGDLVVWPGHVGIVVNPAEKSFYSSLRSGLGVENYDAPAWKKRGKPRFYRYVKAPLAPLEPGAVNVAGIAPDNPATPKPRSGKQVRDLASESARSTLEETLPTNSPAAESAKATVKAKVVPSTKTVFPPAVADRPPVTTSDGPEE